MGRKKKKLDIGECVHCGEVGPVTMDHVPPKNLFNHPRPSDLVTVPACKGCNERASKDDEVFRNLLVTRADVGDHPAANRVLSVVMESLARPQAAGLRRAFTSSLMRVDLFSPGGIYLGTRAGYRVDLKRINRVARRTVTGLFFKRTGRRLPDQYRASVSCLSGVDSVTPKNLPHLQEVLRLLGTEPATDIGNGIFSYRFRLSEDDPFGSVWLLVFFGRVIFVGGTLPRSFKLELTPEVT
jgi:hypothetical protein